MLIQNADPDDKYNTHPVQGNSHRSATFSATQGGGRAFSVADHRWIINIVDKVGKADD
jgi:hypothetical protein